MRSQLEDDSKNPQASRSHQRMVAFLKETGALSEAEPTEIAIFETPLGALKDQDHTNGFWRLEAAAILLWTIERLEFPQYDQITQIQDVAEGSGFLSPDFDPAATALDVDELKEAQNHLFAVHWRITQFGLDRKPMNFEEFAKTAWFGPLDLEGLDLVDGDLAFEGKPISKLKKETFEVMRSAATERHQAINWLCGDAETYSQVGADT